jgi:2,4-dienoyl-CoA reductase-like NADH-dependent reductase (Old Yellow Enzyme family)
VRIDNRIVKSAMSEGSADPRGFPTKRLIRMYERWARGGVGLIITGMAHVRAGYGYAREIGLYADDLVPALRELTDASHRHGGKVFAQLCHAPPQIPRARALELGAVAPSAGFVLTNWLFHRAISGRELSELVDDFAQAARRAREAGFDGVQLHAAHGYLLSRMLSPRHNRRRDRWGGSFERRLTFLTEVVAAVRAAVGDDYPLLVKLNAHDGQRGGLGLDESLQVAQRLEQGGVDGLEISAGIGDVGLGIYPNRGDLPLGLAKRWLGREVPFLKPVTGLLGPVIGAMARPVRFPGEAYFFELARRFAETVSIPVICVGGIRSRPVAERILAESRVAMVSLARPLIRQPGLPRAWRQGRHLEASCVSCNECFVRLGLGHPLRCWKKGDGDVR